MLECSAKCYMELEGTKLLVGIHLGYHDIDDISLANVNCCKTMNIYRIYDYINIINISNILNHSDF